MNGTTQIPKDPTTQLPAVTPALVARLMSEIEVQESASTNTHLDRFLNDVRAVCEGYRKLLVTSQWAVAPGGGLRLRDLRAANIIRQQEWCPTQLPDLSFRGNELAGETGEACNVIKKLERARHGWVGARDTVEHLAEELADIIITADLVALQCGIALDSAVVNKFNTTSLKNNLTTVISEA